MKERRELESQIGDNHRACAGVARRMRDKRAVDHAEGEEMVNKQQHSVSTRPWLQKSTFTQMQL